MHWVPIGAWIAVAVLAVVVLAFCGFELFWKLRRLGPEVARLQRTADGLKTVSQQLAQSGQQLSSRGSAGT